MIEALREDDLKDVAIFDELFGVDDHFFVLVLRHIGRGVGEEVL